MLRLVVDSNTEVAYIGGMQSNQYGPFVVERSKGGGYQVRNKLTGGLSWASSIREARVLAQRSLIRWQDRNRLEGK